jgi:C1A family cysteine protease
LPSHFDAREWGVVPAIRSQGDCASCWAFAAVSSQEITFASRYQQPSNSLNLSEQQLLSCNNKGYSCRQGGFVTEQDSDYRYESGLVGEQTYPYEAQDSPCRRFSRPNSGNLYDIRAFDFVLSADDDVSNLANITKIKQAIYSYGNVWAGVFADPAFQAYDNGVFNACSGGRPNHAINIIGWDDAGGYWIIRNSWNSDWGDNGYAKIKYGCNAIGQSAAVPKLPQLADCNGGNCQPRNASPPPWLRSASSNPVTPPFQPNPAPVPPTESSPPYPLW